ncbi:MAG TPA: hypothetical protein VMB80_02995 [Candidatus Acidoferrum sp.]|nr:hypothetical protein [Candidatus Acidoferrum sp.]
MKKSNLRQFIAAGLALASWIAAPNLPAAVQLFIEGGSASSTVLFDRATNVLNDPNTAITVYGANNSAVRTYVGKSTNSALSGYGTITIDFNLNGAVAGLQNLVNQQTDTNILGSSYIPVLVDSATSPEAVNLSATAAHLKALPTYVVPLVYIKNTNSADTAGITNLTQRQAWSLENTYPPLPATYYGGTSTNPIYFVGRNLEAAVRTEIDLAIYNTETISTYYTNALGQPVLDISADPGQQFAGALANTVLVLTNSIGTIAVQNLKKGLAPLAYEGVPYSVTNLENGSYPLWGYENYYYINTSYAGAPTAAQLAVINALYQSVTNASFQNINNPVFTNNFIPNSALKVYRNFDGGQIFPN